MFSWQSFFGGIASCLAVTENKDQIASCRNEGKSRSLRHCEKTWGECLLFRWMFNVFGNLFLGGLLRASQWRKTRIRLLRAAMKEKAGRYVIARKHEW